MKTKQPKIKTENFDQEIKDLKDQLARARADYSNLEKRIESQRQMYVTLATIGIISKMIDVLDDLNLAQKHLNDPGLKMTIDKFVATLKSEGLEEVNSADSFDHNTMECIATVEGEDNKIISVEKKGYCLNGQCIRPAQVVVSKKADSTEKSAEKPESDTSLDSSN